MSENESASLPLEASKLANKARRQIISMTYRSKASHVGSALSVVDILATLYSGAANINFGNLNSEIRDVVILSKGHAAAALYSVLALTNFFPVKLLESYCEDGALLGGHVTSRGIPGVELSTGSLGHGMPFGVGIAISRKNSGLKGKIIVVISDGECNEGTTWESALLANHHKLNNLIIIIDRNRLQSLMSTEDTLMLEPLEEKWQSFGWNTKKIDGHNHDEIRSGILNYSDKPICIIADTVKGKGIPFMENKVLWHYKPPSEEEYLSAMEILDGFNK